MDTNSGKPNMLGVRDQILERIEHWNPDVGGEFIFDDVNLNHVVQNANTSRMTQWLMESKADVYAHG